MNPVALPLLTSIPPAMTRRAFDGAEVGRDYQSACIQSWRDSGFRPFSVNSTAELAKGSDVWGNIEVLPVQRDAASLTGKPLIYFYDLLQAALSVPGGNVVAFTNADILLEVPPVLMHQLAQLRPEEFVVARRVDVAKVTDREGVPYHDGFDFFALHRDTIASLVDIGLVFGAPWWDHFLPTGLALRGLHPIVKNAPFAFHLRHEERWDREQWYRFGERWIEYLSKQVITDRTSQSAPADFSVRVHAALSHRSSLPRRLGERLRYGVPAQRRLEHHRRLTLLSTVTLELLDEAESTS